MRNLTVKEEHRKLDLRFAKRALSDFFRDNPSRSIRFYGAGEPTLEFDLMTQIRNYAYSLAGDNLRVELQSNGVFSETVRKWVSENVDILWISFDGFPEIQDLQRPSQGGAPTSHVVLQNLDYFVKEAELNKKMQIGFRVTITPETIHRQSEMIEYVHRIGVKYVNAHPACAPAEGSLNEVFDYDPVDFAQNFLIAHERAKELGMFYNSLYIANFDEPTRSACRACIPYPHLTTDGYVSCCDFAQFGPEYDPGPLQQLIYGRYSPDEDRIIYDESKIAKIRSRCAENLGEGLCAGCEFLYNCAGGCVGQALNSTGDIMGIHAVNCQITKYLAERMPRNEGLYPALHS
jgi:radical SAM protein with 4Fe4S-binding SPASM domain